MGVSKNVRTEVHCDVCGEYIMSWNSSRDCGVSKEWAKYFARLEGATTGKKIVCKKCRIKKKIEKCSLIKRWGEAGKDGDGTCLGFCREGDDEPIEKCECCIACTSFDWEEERKRLGK